MELLKRNPKNPGYRNLEAAILARLGETDRAIASYEKVLRSHPQQPKGWMSYGHTLKTAGRQSEAIGAYRKSIVQLPSLGEAYWSLANLKTFRFKPEEIAMMRAQLSADRYRR
jgi:predicted Zn-dependent protease